MEREKKGAFKAIARLSRLEIEACNKVMALGNNKSAARMTLQPQRCFLGVTLFLFVSCQENGTGDIVYHATPDNIPAVTDSKFIIFDEPEDTLLWMQDALRTGDVIGVAEGTPDKMIGSVRGSTLSASLMYYVDGSYSQIRAYDFGGNLVDIIGGPGEGPGEFIFPWFVSVTENNDTLVVIGSGGRNISVFSKNRDGRHSFQTSFRAEALFVGGGLCAMHGHVYTTGYSEETAGAIHKHTVQGQYLESFGASYNHPKPLIRRNMAKGAKIACNATHRTILYAHPHAPIVTGFTEAGDVRWRVKLADARIAPMRETIESKDVSSVTGLPPRIRESRGLRIIGVKDGDMFWLIRSERMTEERDQWTDHLYTVDALTGQGKYLGSRPYSLQAEDEEIRAILAVDNERILTIRPIPYPQLGIHPILNSAP